MKSRNAQPLAQEPASRAAVEEFLRERGAQTVRVGWSDLHGICRGKRLSVEHFLESLDSGVSFSVASMEMNLRGEVVEGFFDGTWPNLFAVPDVSTLRPAPQEPDTFEVNAELRTADGRSVHHAPRAVLRRVLERAQRMGYQLQAGVEFEFYLFHDDECKPLRPGRQAYRMRCGPSEDGFLQELRLSLAGSGYHVETAGMEDGPGQFELSLRHGSALNIADAAFAIKCRVKEVASKRGLLATFIPKPLEHEAGSGFHVHQQLRTAARGEPVFADPRSRDGLSTLCNSFIAGQLQLLPALCLIAMPTINAYKRLLSRGRMPLAPNWGLDNRTAALRVLGNSPASLRVEHRVAGGEANPYLLVAALLASGLHGIEGRMEAPPPVYGSGYGRGAGGKRLPRSLAEAVDLFSASEVLRDWLGDTLVDRFSTLKSQEAERYERAITDWERQEYLEYL